MWIFLRDSFLSIVQHEDEPRLLQVRARVRGDIERIFPESFVAEDIRGDYRFRAVVGRERVSHAIALRLNQVDYTSLNDVVEDPNRSLAYDKAYGAMLEEQVARYGTELDLPGFIPRYDLEADPEAPVTHESIAE
jgi:hypothetical protein